MSQSHKKCFVFGVNLENNFSDPVNLEVYLQKWLILQAISGDVRAWKLSPDHILTKLQPQVFSKYNIHN